MGMNPRSRPATVADLYAIRGKAELVGGSIVRMPPTGGRPARASLAIVMSLYQHAHTPRIGEAVPDNTGFVVNLPNRRSFFPDTAFWLGEPPTMKFYEGAPVFAVEVRSKSDYRDSPERAMAEKRQDYFAAGTLVVWDIDLQGPNLISAYSANQHAAVRKFRRGDVAEGDCPADRAMAQEMLADMAG